jgi:preprotein translocase subunit SecG
MLILLTIVHVIICLSLMAVILLQSGKGGNIAGAFGAGGGSQTLFGGRGASTFLTKGTMILGTLFFLTSVLLAFMSRSGGGTTTESLIQRDAKARGVSPVSIPATQAPGQSGTAPAQTAPSPVTQTPAKGGK